MNHNVIFHAGKNPSHCCSALTYRTTMRKNEISHINYSELNENLMAVKEG